MVLHGIRYYCRLVMRTALMVDSITFCHEMVNILVSREEYDKVFNQLDMLNAPLEGKGNGYHQKAENQSQMDKTEHWNGKDVQIRPKSKNAKARAGN
ncbi:hypothetical protein Tco_1188898 [Tanacetum coccineum]